MITDIRTGVSSIVVVNDHTVDMFVHKTSTSGIIKQQFLEYCIHHPSIYLPDVVDVDTQCLYTAHEIELMAKKTIPGKMPNNHTINSEYRKFTITKYNSIKPGDLSSQTYLRIHKHPQFQLLSHTIENCNTYDELTKLISTKYPTDPLLQTCLQLYTFVQNRIKLRFFFDISENNVAIHKKNIILLDPIC